ncbi:MAG TPA: hypothetical protein VLT88_12370, partial [Desulfosarcina sp.]|nr:hypothetical protein [Desulfosarcina sp.]
ASGWSPFTQKRLGSQAQIGGLDGDAAVFGKTQTRSKISNDKHQIPSKFQKANLKKFIKTADGSLLSSPRNRGSSNSI